MSQEERKPRPSWLARLNLRTKRNSLERPYLGLIENEGTLCALSLTQRQRILDPKSLAVQKILDPNGKSHLFNQGIRPLRDPVDGRWINLHYPNGLRLVKLVGPGETQTLSRFEEKGTHLILSFGVTQNYVLIPQGALGIASRLRGRAIESLVDPALQIVPSRGFLLFDRKSSLHHEIPCEGLQALEILNVEEAGDHLFVESFEFVASANPFALLGTFGASETPLCKVVRRTLDLKAKTVIQEEILTQGRLWFPQGRLHSEIFQDHSVLVKRPARHEPNSEIKTLTVPGVFLRSLTEPFVLGTSPGKPSKLYLIDPAQLEVTWECTLPVELPFLFPTAALWSRASEPSRGP